MMQDGNEIPIIIEEIQGITRLAEPVTIGIPLVKGHLNFPSEMVLLDVERKVVPIQCQDLCHWEDQSIKWLLLDFSVSITAFEKKVYHIERTEDQDRAPLASGISVHETKDPEAIVVDTGKAIFYLGLGRFNPFQQVVINSVELLDGKHFRIVMTDSIGDIHTPQTLQMRIETLGPVRTTIRAEGQFLSPVGRPVLDFVSRMTFYSNSALVKLAFTVKNPRAAQHIGGLWDLGDQGSFFFKDLSFHMSLSSIKNADIFLTADNGPASCSTRNEPIEIYQDSSGGNNWNCMNHVDRYGEVSTSFRGYRVYSTSEDVIAEGNRATPDILINTNELSFAATVEKFWQNFPKSIRVDANGLIIGLFPKRFQSDFELQAGEQKTHTVYFDFNPGQARLNWIQQPLSVKIPPKQYEETGGFRYLANSEATQNSLFQSLIDEAIDSENSLFQRREVIDEYGWRNFGDLFADHETFEKTDFEGDRPFVSHYNNQYDVIYSAFMQFARSGDHRWFQLAKELADHVIDIDIYHTDEDRSVFNRGFFWHTDHFADAATATHRSVSIETKKLRGLKSYGGGPGYEHNYTRGLLYYYLLTGEVKAREAVLELASWTCCGINNVRTFCEHFEGMAKKILQWIRNRRGKNKALVPYRFNGPGRASGNALNVLLDTFALTKQRFYLEKAEMLIRNCIHPQDDIDDRELLNPNVRWFYSIFLQALGNYLDIKREMDKPDAMFAYGRASLIHYARWILEHEYPYLSKPERLDYPNYATRAAQDLRKCNILLFASKYSDGSVKESFLEKADYFFYTVIDYLKPLETKNLTRPLAIVMQNSGMRAFFKSDFKLADNVDLQSNDLGMFGQPKLTILSKAIAIVSLYYSIASHTSLKKEFRFIRFRIKDIIHSFKNDAQK